MNAIQTSTLIALGLLAATGCTPQQHHTRGQVSTEPLVIDQAMQQRQWEPVTAYVENGSTKSGSTGFAYEPRQGMEGYQGSAYYLADVGTFFVNLVTLPYTLWVERDGVVSGGEQIPPSYTANPPLPPSRDVPETSTAAEPRAPVDATPIDPTAAPATQP